MALRPEIVDFVGLQLVKQLGQIDRVGKIAIMQKESHSIDVWILIKMINAGRVEGAGPADNPVDFVALGHQ